MIRELSRTPRIVQLIEAGSVVSEAAAGSSTINLLPRPYAVGEQPSAPFDTKNVLERTRFMVRWEHEIREWWLLALAKTLLKKPPGNVKPASLSSLRRNAVLNAMSAANAERVVEHGTLVNLALRQQIYEAEQPIHDVYFPLDSVLSVVARMRDGSQIEIGTIGREGMSAFPLLLGASSTANVCYCQVRGSAIKIPASLFHQIVESDRAFRQVLDRYLQAYINMLGQLAACNRLHSVYERCARWLLMTRDRVDTDQLPLTQEFLAMMLGTGRSGVAIAAATFQQAGFIRYAHGTITMLDRPGLENAACECYEVAREQFDGLLRDLRR
jgi:CRP-like cAMP-binding protein